MPGIARPGRPRATANMARNRKNSHQRRAQILQHEEQHERHRHARTATGSTCSRRGSPMR